MSPLRPWQRLSVRLAALFVAVTLIGVGLVGGLIYEHQKRDLEETLGEALLNIARTGVLLAAPFAAEAQQAGRAPVIGILTPAPAGEAPTGLPGKDPLPPGLRDLGYTEGRNIRVEYRSSGGHDERFPALATDLVASKVDIIVAATVPAIRAAQQATRTIPIVMVLSSDPVRLGLIKSLARPGGNTTGLASLTFDLSRKRVELLKSDEPGDS